jgi:hypothetical protein
MLAINIDSAARRFCSRSVRRSIPVIKVARAALPRSWFLVLGSCYSLQPPVSSLFCLPY